MKIPINLATQAFRRDRPILVASVVLSLAMVGALGVLISLIVTDRAQLADTRASVARLDRDLRATTAEQSKLDAVLRQPENAEVLERSIFLNTLLYRKGISWTRIFADLEKTLPYNVRVISIRPWVNAQSQISLEMNLGAESVEPMIETLKRLQASPLFNLVTMPSVLPPSQSEPLYRCRVSVNYAQKL